jgi:hypothetical protein
MRIGCPTAGLLCLQLPDVHALSAPGVVVPTLTTSAAPSAPLPTVILMRGATRSAGVAATIESPRTKEPSVRHVPRKFILQSELFFLETVEKVFVGVGSMLFFLDEGVKSLMLRFQFLDHCLVHWRGSFRSACHHRLINHESDDLSWALSHFAPGSALLAASRHEVPPRAPMR